MTKSTELIYQHCQEQDGLAKSCMNFKSLSSTKISLLSLENLSGDSGR